MGFMKMLAQNTQIDGRSRWEDAERSLRDDTRFKAVPEPSDREDLFNEFVDALTKKEKVKLEHGCFAFDSRVSVVVYVVFLCTVGHGPTAFWIVLSVTL